jgi:predicted TIM-barrel fold metal-dependent hydrolase
MPGTVVDAHVHVYPAASWSRRRRADHPITEYGDGRPLGTSHASGDLEGARAALARAGAVAGLAFNLYEPGRITFDLRDLPPDAGLSADSSNRDYLVWLNRWLCDALRDDRQLYPVVAIDPGAMPPWEIAGHISEVIDLGAVGVKLHHTFQGLAIDDPRLDAVYAACSELSLPLVVHTGIGSSPRAFRPILEKWTRLTLLLAHAGGAAWREAPAIADEFPNAAFDLAELLWWIGAPGAPSRAELASLLRSIGTSRVLFGSDFPWYEPALGMELVRSLPLGSAAIDAILGENARKIFALHD